MLHSSQVDAVPASVPVQVLTADIAPSGLERRHRIRLPDGRIVWSDCFQGEAKSLTAVLNESGAVLVLPEARYSPTGREPWQLGIRRSGNPQRTINRQTRLEKLVEACPNCPVCGCILLMPITGRRATARQTACFDDAGRAICAGCRSKQRNG